MKIEFTTWPVREIRHDDGDLSFEECLPRYATAWGVYRCDAEKTQDGWVWICDTWGKAPARQIIAGLRLLDEKINNIPAKGRSASCKR